MQQNIIYEGNSVISVETHPEYSHPVVIKKPSKRHPSQRDIRPLENEYEITRPLDAVKGVRQALGQKSIGNQPALILEYIDGETLRDHIKSKTLSLHARLEIAVDLTRILGKIHQQDVIHLDLNRKKHPHRSRASSSLVNRFGICFSHRPQRSSKSPARPVIGDIVLHRTGTDRTHQPCGG